MKRFVDPLFEPYSVYHILVRGGSVVVKCPVCQGPANITSGNPVRLRCEKCLYSALSPATYVYHVATNCNCCERWFNEQFKDERQFSQKYVHFPCPHCQTDNVVELKKRERGLWAIPEIRNEREPFFGEELYFLDSYRGKPVWALNHDHLNYLIEYIGADLRERPNSGYTRTASYRLPKYMKEAKNRDGLLKVFKKMQLRKA